jgi:hypothetical protein
VVGPESGGGSLPGGAHAGCEGGGVDVRGGHGSMVRRAGAWRGGLPVGARGRILSASPGG